MRVKGRYLPAVDLLCISAAAVAAFVIRYESLWRIGPYLVHNAPFFLAVLFVRPLLYHLFGLYRCWWRYASVPELITIVQAVTAGSLIVAALLFGFLAPVKGGVRSFSRSVLLLEWMLNLLFIGGVRFLLRLWQRQAGIRKAEGEGKAFTRVLIMGAGDAGALILREMQNNPALGYLPVGFIDDAPDKQGAQIYGVPVLGTREDIPRLVREHHVDEVIIAMPTAPGSAIRQVRAICERCQVRAKTIPGLYELLSGTVSISQIREVKIEDLLRREPVRTDMAAVRRYISGAVVLVTGAGGSIGSELCRQIAAARPKELLLLGHGENSIYNIWLELKERFGHLPTVPLIADVRDRERITHLLLKHRPQVIFHAAAHKHVPLMELNPVEAFTTNVLGTENLLRAAEEAGVDRFVLISSDKAVNPVNIMGASKHLAEVLVRHAAKRTGHRYVVVRFGNVLGSRGSVVPLFERQIAAGGPVTVTHPEMTRYFMTIPEAVQLVLQAAVLGQGGEIFVLDMGEQIRILDLARDLISLSGLTPGEDIEIVFTGVRPGEKLYEELFGEGEEPLPTAHQQIFQTFPAHLPTEEELGEGIVAILRAAQAEDTEALSLALKQLIPSFCPAAELTVPPLPEEVRERSVQQPGLASGAKAAAPGHA
ncbi:MAG: polysaccharide biosynthesis protein [Anaerolineae bacterium]|nr:polysaccharide biosynthesis protein [Anaerolineae bacterium]